MSETTITPEYVMQQVATGKQYLFAILKDGPTPIQDEALRKATQMQHLQFLFEQKAKGIILLVGPITDDAWDVGGIVIINSTDKEAMKELFAQDPYAVAGHYRYEFYDWFGIPGDGI